MMDKQTFQRLWAIHYPQTPPISHQFKRRYLDRWFRIHSLPDSRRYAETSADWQELLFRQNTLMTALFGESSLVWIVIGYYGGDDQSIFADIAKQPLLGEFVWIVLDGVPDDEQVFKAAFAPMTWRTHGYDALLRAVADDELRVFFVSFEKSLIIAPYDGGVDIIAQDETARDHHKQTYQAWLSPRADGL